MSRIGRRNYHVAAVELLQKARFSVRELATCQMVAQKGERKLYIDIAGKNLPYCGANGKQAFAWETHVELDRLDRICARATACGAEPWLGLCYAILDSEFESEFGTVVEVAYSKFGLKLISISDYRKFCHPRSQNAWKVVDLPRQKVKLITLDPKDVM